MKLFRKDEGFTLVELMVVVLIIGILVAIAVPIFNSAKASAQKRACQSNQRALEGAYQTYYADQESGTFTPPAQGSDLTALLVTGNPSYIKAIKACPTDGTALVWVYPDANTTSAINVDCASTAVEHSR